MFPLSPISLTAAYPVFDLFKTPFFYIVKEEVLNSLCFASSTVKKNADFWPNMSLSLSLSLAWNCVAGGHGIKMHEGDERRFGDKGNHSFFQFSLLHNSLRSFEMRPFSV